MDWLEQGVVKKRGWVMMGNDLSVLGTGTQINQGEEEMKQNHNMGMSEWQTAAQGGSEKR